MRRINTNEICCCQWFPVIYANKCSLRSIPNNVIVDIINELNLKKDPTTFVLCQKKKERLSPQEITSYAAKF